MLIYNSKSALSSEAIKKLAIAATLGEKIKSKQSQNAQVNLIFKATTDFVWVVRDFALATNESAHDKLKKFLATEQFTPNPRLAQEANDKKQDEVELRNKIRNSINDVFDEKTCFYVPVPVAEGTAGLSYEDALQSMDTLAYDQLRPVFRAEIEKISKHVIKNIQVKTVENTRMNGRLFCEYLKRIVEHINNENVIYINDTIDLCLKSYGDELLREVTSLYNTTMNVLTKNGKHFPIDEFNKKESEIYKNCVANLKQKLLNCPKTLADKCMDSFINAREKDVNGQAVGLKKPFYDMNIARLKDSNFKIGISCVNQIKMNLDVTNFQTLNDFKDSVKLKVKNQLTLGGLDFEQFWLELTRKVNFDQIERDVENKLKVRRDAELAKQKLERDNLAKKLQEQQEKEQKEKREREARESQEKTKHEQALKELRDSLLREQQRRESAESRQSVSSFQFPTPYASSNSYSPCSSPMASYSFNPCPSPMASYSNSPRPSPMTSYSSASSFSDGKIGGKNPFCL